MRYVTRAIGVDDDPEMRELLETLFKLIGFATFQAGNNTEALAQALTHHPDLITTDMFRPGGSGFEFIQQIRAITALQDSPIVMISGVATPKTAASKTARSDIDNAEAI